MPPPVRPGDTVAIVSPSFGAVAAWPHRAEAGTRYLRSLGLEVKLMPHAGGADGWVSAAPEERADDLHQAFQDPDVRMVLASIGGNHSNQLLPHLDHDLLRAHPTWFQGYSDMTVLHWALLKHAGVATLYGSALTTGLGEHPAVLPYTDRWLRAAWFRTEPLRYEPAAVWTEELLDWDEKKDLERPRRLEPSRGWVPLRSGEAEGPVLGGCIETICWHLKGSGAWLDPAGAILLLEPSEEAPSPAHVHAYLIDLEQLGVFDAIRGLLFARPMGYTADDTEVLWNVLRDVTAPYGLPVLANVDCGHTDPMLTLPLGVPARLDAGAARLEVLL